MEASAAMFPTIFWIACKILSVADTVPAPEMNPVMGAAIARAFVKY